MSHAQSIKLFIKQGCKYTPSKRSVGERTNYSGGYYGTRLFETRYNLLLPPKAKLARRNSEICGVWEPQAGYNYKCIMMG